MGVHELYGQAKQADVSGLVSALSDKAPSASPTLTGTATFAGRRVDTPALLTYGVTVAINAALGSKFDLTATGNPTIEVPTNGVDGQEITLRITASGAARTPTFSASYEIGRSVANRSPEITSGATLYARIECRGGTTWRLLAID